MRLVKVEDEKKEIQKEERQTKTKQKQVKTIGRSAKCDIVLNDNTVSRQHATLEENSDGTFKLTDLHSTNGTYFDDKKISTAILQRGEQFIIGKFLVATTGEFSRLDEKTVVKANGASKMYANGKVGIHPITFEIKPKTLTAIMGPSGCGKSTLLKMLNGVSRHTSGEVSLFDLDLIRNFNYFKHQIGYVPQDDIIHLELTVYQSIYYAAKLRLENFNEQTIQAKIDELLKKLKIEAIKNQLNSEISGGQRKRVCIAIELLSDPMLLLLDEPTSPLDPQAIEEFMKILQELSQGNTTVVLVTHKPEDLQFMDEVIFLSEGGYLAYKGKTENYLSHFGVQNTVEVYSLLSGKNAKRWSKTETKNVLSHSRTEKITENVNVSWFQQLYWLTIRAVKIKTNDRVNSLITILQAPIIAFLIGFIFNKVTLGVLFMMVISSIWFGVNNAAREIVKEKNIFNRERLFNVYNSTYLFSKFNTLLFIGIVQTVLFTSILFLMYSTSENPLNSPFKLIVWLLFVNLVSSSLGLMISSAMKTSDKVLALVPIILIPQLMLSGVITKINNGFIEFISYFTFSRWGTEGLAHIQQTVIVERIETNQTNAVRLLNEQYNDAYFTFFGQFGGNFSLDFVMLLFLGIAIFATTYLLLTRQIK